MSVIASRATESLEWTQPSAFRMEYDLHAGSDVLATLRFRSSFGTHAVAQVGSDRWTFKRVGFWQQRATIRRDGDAANLAEFVNATWAHGGELRLADGGRWRATTNFWSTRLAWTDEADHEWVALKPGGLVRLHAAVELAPGAGAGVPVDLLVVFGFYLLVMIQSDSAAVAAAAG